MKNINNITYEITLIGLIIFYSIPVEAQCDFTDQKSGRRYIGECKSSTINGNITRIPDGQGKQINPDGSYFIGKFSNGQRVSGTYYWEDGQRVDSAIYENDELKSGIYRYPSGAKYEGSFKNDKFDGKGIYYHKPNSDKLHYRGIFKGGMYNGQGVLTYKDGRTQDGQWKEDIFLGKQIGTLYEQPVYWDQLNKITTSKETFEIESQNLYSLTVTIINNDFNKTTNKQTKYFYLKDGNFIIAVIEVIKSEMKNYGGTYGRTNLEGIKTTIQTDVILNKDAKLLSHLNRNQYNKSAKLPLTHLNENLYFDANHCIWVLFSEKASVYHNPQNKYENLKFVRPVSNQYFSHETIINVDNSIIQKIKNGEYPTIINGKQIKAGEYQQTYNFEHSAFQTLAYENKWYGYNWLNYYNHYREDVALHKLGWVHYAEFPQNNYDNATKEELLLFEKCINDIERLNEYASKAPVRTVITSTPKQNTVPTKIEDIVSLINKTCDDALIEHLKKYPLNLFNLLASQKIITENTVLEQIATKNYNINNNAEKAILRLMQLIPKDKYIEFLRYLEKDNNSILRNLVSNMSDKTVRLIGNNNYSSFIKELIRMYNEIPDFWIFRFSKLENNKLLGQIINLYSMPFKSDWKEMSSSFGSIKPLNQFRFVGYYNTSTGTINIYREQQILTKSYISTVGLVQNSFWVNDKEATASNLSPLDPIIILTNKELPIVQIALKGGQFSDNAYVVPAIFFQYKGQKEFNQFFVDAGGITLDIVSIVGSGGIALATKAHWAVRLWAWTEIASNIGDIVNRIDLIKNEQVKKAIDCYNAVLLLGSVSGISLSKFESKMPIIIQTVLRENKDALSIIQNSYSSWELIVEKIDRKELSENDLNVLREEFSNYQKLGVIDESNERTKKVKEIIFSIVSKKVLISTSGEQFTVSEGDTFEGEIKDGKIVQGKIIRNGETVKIFWNKRNH